MKHIDENGYVESADLKILLSDIEDRVKLILNKWDVSSLEAQVISKHITSSVNFAATQYAFRKVNNL